MLKRPTVTLHHVITVYNDMFDHMDGMMRALAKKNNQWKEDMFFTVKFAGQKLSRYYSEVTLTTGMVHISAHIPILSGSCDFFNSGTREWIFILRGRNPILPNTKRPFWRKW